jgi:hypothetical protein
VDTGVVIGRSDSGRFRHYDERGRLVGIVDVPMERREIPRSEEQAIIDEFLDVARSSVMASRPSVGEHYSLYNLMWPVSDSLFALQQSWRTGVAGERPIDEGHFVWRVFSVRGHYAGAIVFPAGAAQPYWIEPGRITATRRDSLGVATIETYRIEPPR